MAGIGAFMKGMSKAGASGVAAKARAMGKGKMLQVGIETIQSAGAVNYRMDQGDSLFGAAIKEAGETALYLHPLTAPFMYTKDIANLAYHGVKGAYAFRRQRHDAYNAMRETAYGNTIGGHYMDTNAALTMRQAAVQQIQSNKLNARSSLGGEARIFADKMPFRR